LSKTSTDARRYENIPPAALIGGWSHVTVTYVALCVSDVSDNRWSALQEMT